MVDIRGTLTTEQESYFKKQFNFVRPLPESKTVTENGENRILYQADIESLTHLEEIKTLLQTLDNPSIIGLWVRGTGLQQGYKYEIEYDESNQEVSRTIVRNQIDDGNGSIIDEPIAYPLNIDEYYKYIDDNKKPATTEDARGFQMNKWLGMPDRNLELMS